MTTAMTVIIPAFNEERRLIETLPRLLHRLPEPAEILIVDDGSTDRTAIVAESLLAHRRHGRVVRLPWNQGKGAAVRAGVTHATGDPIVYMDADLSADLDDLDRVVAALGYADVVVGSRLAPHAEVLGQSRVRNRASRTFNRATRLLAGLDVGDTQCGFKAFRSSTAKVLFAMQHLDGFAFDVEVLTLAKELNLSTVEIPIRWHGAEGSKVRWHVDPATMLCDIVRLRWRHRHHQACIASWTAMPDSSELEFAPLETVAAYAD
jgi:glycosyltransferase involved in cell wall biosynthesis